jgi:VIT1/CCC1 family predicted Fe2+/Mn2+ transporter
MQRTHEAGGVPDPPGRHNAEIVTPERPFDDREWLAAHLREERREADLLGEIREVIFGAQDGVTSILAVVSTVAGATHETSTVLIAGIAAALAEVFSMGAGEYMSSKSQREIYEAQIAKEREEVDARPGESLAEVAFMLEREGLEPQAARRVAAELARSPEVLLKTMVEKELGLTVEPGAGPLQGALILAGVFAVAALIPIIPYAFLPVTTAIPISVVVSLVATFAIGAVKSRWTLRSPVVSGLEVVALAAFAGVAGYFFGSILPGLLGVPPPPG